MSEGMWAIESMTWARATRRSCTGATIWMRRTTASARPASRAARGGVPGGLLERHLPLTRRPQRAVAGSLALGDPLAPLRPGRRRAAHAAVDRLGRQRRRGHYDDSTPADVLSEETMRKFLIHTTVEHQHLAKLLPKLYEEYKGRPDDEVSAWGGVRPYSSFRRAAQMLRRREGLASHQDGGPEHLAGHPQHQQARSAPCRSSARAICQAARSAPAV